MYNWLANRFGSKCRAEEILMLLPRCLQNSLCTQKIVNDISNCQLCGKCDVAEIVQLSCKYGIPLFMATGGLMARDYVQKLKPRLIIAVACENELIDGVLKVFPRRVFAVRNSRPNGPCKDTCVDVKTIEAAIVRFLKK